ncbi:MAG: LarC family nickel insertion protein [Pseudomonadota bacterium]
MMASAVHLHLDPLGGMAGDMFIAALLDARPDLEPAFEDAVRACALPAGWRVQHSRRKTRGIDARTFDVVAPDGPTRASGRYAALMERIDAMPLGAGTRRRAADIYTRLGECEATVHGVALADVHFHELADWDSVVDIVGAAALLEALGVSSASSAAIPLGSGQVRTAHGPLPVPAPATARLLADMTVWDDGVGGERVTPTGAAILAHLGVSGAGRPREPFHLRSTGLGAGMREFESLANVLRVQLMTPQVGGTVFATVRDEVGEVRFDIDDQSPEDLAAALARLRQANGVLDVASFAGAGKKARQLTAVHVLCELPDLEAVARLCLTETTTLGVRMSRAERLTLPREVVSVDSVHGPVAVKLALRPDGTVSAKAEHDQLSALQLPAAERRALAAALEHDAVAAHGARFADAMAARST